MWTWWKYWSYFYQKVEISKKWALLVLDLIRWCQTKYWSYSIWASCSKKKKVVNVSAPTSCLPRLSVYRCCQEWASMVSANDYRPRIRLSRNPFRSKKCCNPIRYSNNLSKRFPGKDKDKLPIYCALASCNSSYLKYRWSEEGIW